MKNTTRLVPSYSHPIFSDLLQFYLVETNLSNKKMFQAKNITMEPVEEGACLNPSFSLTLEEGQILVNRLWDLGIKPKQASSSTGQLGAVLYHLEDMRRLVFRKNKHINRSK